MVRGAENMGMLKTAAGFAALAAALSLAGCSGVAQTASENTGSEGEALTQPAHLGFTVPNGVDYRNVAVVSSGVLLLGDRSVLVKPTGTYAGSSTTGSGAAHYGYDTRVGNITSSGSVEVFDRAAVNGSITAGSSITFGTNHLPTPAAGNVILTGSFSPNADIATKPFSRGWDIAFQTSTNNRNITTGTVSLPPGAYNMLNIQGGTLALSSGTYYIDSITLEPPAKISVTSANGPTIIYLRTSFIDHGTWSASAPDKVLLGYLGTSLLALEKPFAGTVVAPNARIRLAVGNASHQGAILGKETELDPGVTLTFKPFSRWDVFNLDAGGPIGGPVAPTPLDPPNHGTLDECWAPAFTTTSSGGQINGLHYATPDPTAGICTPTFCDANDNVVASPTDAQLNTAPPTGSTCPAVGSSDDCPIDPTTLGASCTNDANCSAGFLCAATCADVQCTQVQHRCGKPAASCSALAAKSNCDIFTLCPLDCAVGTPNPAALASALGATAAADDSAAIPGDEWDILPDSYTPATALLCVGANAGDTVDTHDGSDKPANDGSKKWGVYVEPTSNFKLNPVKRHDDIQEFGMSSNVGFAAGGILFGNKLEVLSAQLGTAIDDCGITVNSTVKLFGETVVAITPSAAQTVNLALNDDGSLGTPTLDRQGCGASREQTKQALQDTRATYLHARTVNEYYSKNGLTQELCDEIQSELDSPVKDTAGNAYNCGNLGTIPPDGQASIINGWKKQYDGKVQDYLNFADSVGSRRQAIHAQGTINLFDNAHPYHLKILDLDFPIGPIDINLAIDGYGFWDVAGGVQVGLGIDGNFTGVTNVLGNGLKGQSPRAGDIRAYGGPVITPSAGVGVLVFAGVGIPGISIGLEGKIDLLDISLPGGVVVAAMRLSEDDPRTTTGTDYAGAPKAGMVAADYRWVTGWQWSQQLDLSELKGQLNLAARVHILFFSHTFRMKLFDWKGYKQNFILIGAAGGNGLDYFGDYGKQGGDLAYTEMVDIQPSQVIFNPTGPDAPVCTKEPH